MKIIEVIADHGHRDTIIGIAEQHAVTDWWRGADNDDGRESTRLLVGPANRQQVLDGLQKALGVANNVRIMVIPLEA
ncbi:MAG TPA: TIGR00341 family protein, partial [Chromatiaceae bacterium]|nr:TIGR00341 family protein [Chromatiaceae bacterium]